MAYSGTARLLGNCILFTCLILANAQFSNNPSSCLSVSSLCESGPASDTSSICSDYCFNCIQGYYTACCTETAQPAIRNCVDSIYENDPAPVQTVTTVPGGITFVYTWTDWGPDGGEINPNYIDTETEPDEDIYFSSCKGYFALVDSCTSESPILTSDPNWSSWNANWINCICYGSGEDDKPWLPARMDCLWSQCRDWHVQGRGTFPTTDFTGTLNMTAPCRDAGDIRALGITGGEEPWTSTVSGATSEATCVQTATAGSTANAGPAETETSSSNRVEVGIVTLVTVWVMLLVRF